MGHKGHVGHKNHANYEGHASQRYHERWENQRDQEFKSGSFRPMRSELELKNK